MSKIPSAEEIQKLTDAEGVGAATRGLYDSLRASARHGPFIRAVDTHARHPRAPMAVAIAPAALYKEYRRSGADGRRLRETAENLGMPVTTVPLRPTGTLEENARILLSWLSNDGSEDVILVSLSKGAADIKKALALDPAPFRRVRTWINVGGLLEGTPLVPWLLSGEKFPTAFRLLNRLRGVDLAFLKEVERRPGGPLDFDLRLPPHLKAIHLMGFPMAGHASNWLSRTFYKRLASQGPNDGFMLLKDLARWPGLIYPLWGADHYFRTQEDPRPLLEKLLAMAADGDVLERLYAEGQYAAA